MSGRLWFQIASVFADIQRMCREAQAAELRAKEQAEREAQEARAAPAVAGSIGPPPSAARGADVVALRNELRSRLVWLKARLAETLTERETYYALFPMVVYTDELAQAATTGRASAWPPLQRELYDIDNGGEAFYTTLETLLRREETSPLIFEVFYLCSSAGFMGQYASDKRKVEEYRARLAFRIPVERPKTEGERAAEDKPVELIEFPKWYYAGAAATVAGMFVLVRLLGYFEALARAG